MLLWSCHKGCEPFPEGVHWGPSSIGIVAPDAERSCPRRIQSTVRRKQAPLAVIHTGKSPCGKCFHFCSICQRSPDSKTAYRPSDTTPCASYDQSTSSLTEQVCQNCQKCTFLLLGHLILSHDAQSLQPHPILSWHATFQVSLSVEPRLR